MPAPFIQSASLSCGSGALGQRSCPCKLRHARFNADVGKTLQSLSLSELPSPPWRTVIHCLWLDAMKEPLVGVRGLDRQLSADEILLLGLVSLPTRCLGPDVRSSGPSPLLPQRQLTSAALGSGFDP